MKPFLSILLFLSGSAFGPIAAVTKNPNNNEITGNLVMGNNRLLKFNPNSLLLLDGIMRTGGYGDGGKVQVNNSGLIFGNVDGMLTVQGRRPHVARRDGAEVAGEVERQAIHSGEESSNSNCDVTHRRMRWRLVLRPSSLHGVNWDHYRTSGA